MKERTPPTAATFLMPSWSAAIDEIIDIKNVIKRVIEAIKAVRILHNVTRACIQETKCLFELTSFSIY